MIMHYLSLPIRGDIFSIWKYTRYFVSLGCKCGALYTLSFINVSIIVFTVKLILKNEPFPLFNLKYFNFENLTDE